MGFAGDTVIPQRWLVGQVPPWASQESGDLARRRTHPQFYLPKTPGMVSLEGMVDIRTIQTTAEDLPLVGMDPPLKLIRGAAGDTGAATVAGEVTEGIFTETAIVGVGGAPITDIN